MARLRSGEGSHLKLFACLAIPCVKMARLRSGEGRVSPAAALASPTWSWTPRPRTRSATVAIFNFTSLLTSLPGIRGCGLLFPLLHLPRFEVQVNLISTVGFTAIVTLAPPAPASSQTRPWLTQENRTRGRSFLTKAPLFHFTELSLHSSTLKSILDPSCFSGSQLTTDLSVPAFIGKLNKYVWFDLK